MVTTFDSSSMVMVCALGFLVMSYDAMKAFVNTSRRKRPALSAQKEECLCKER